MSKTFKKFRGIDDRTLGAALANHTDVLKAIAHATTMLLRERRLVLAWGTAVTAAVMYLLWAVQ